MVDFSFDRVEYLNSTYLEGAYNLSKFEIRELNRSTYGFNLEIEFFYGSR